MVTLKDEMVYRDIGLRLRASREQAELSQSATARSSNYAKTTISGWENGCFIPLPAIIRLADLYEEDPCWIAFGDRSRARVLDLSSLTDDQFDTVRKVVKTLRSQFDREALRAAEEIPRYEPEQTGA